MFTDFRYVVRSLWRAPGFTSVAVLTLALGIGSAAAIFNVVDWVLFRAAPFPDDLVLVGSKFKETEFNPVTLDPEMRAFRGALDAVFSEQAVTTHTTANIAIDGEPVGSRPAEISVNSFRMLGITPALGRDFLPGEEVEGRNTVVIIAHAFWQEKFHGAPDVLGRKLRVGEDVCTVVGVLPRSVTLPIYFWGDVFRPLSYRPNPATPWDPILFLFAKLRPGVTTTQAEQAIAGVKTDLPAWMTAGQTDRRPALASMKELKKSFRPEIHWLLVGAVGFLYGIACLNGANLMLVRMLGRRSELSIRIALGSGQAALLRLILTEALVITSAAALVAVLLANWLTPLFHALSWGNENLKLAQWSLGWRPLVLLVVLTVLTSLVLVLGPALRIVRSNPHDGLKDGGAALGESRNLGRLRGLLVVLQSMFAVILLTGAGLMARSFDQLQTLPLGFTENHRSKLMVALPSGYVSGNEERLALLKRLQEHLRHVPGIVSVVYGSDPLLPGREFAGNKVQLPDGTTANVAIDFLSPGYLEATGIALKRGRVVNTTGAEVMINEALAKARFGDQDPIGQFLKPENMQGGKATGWLIVGVVGNVRQSVREAPGFRIIAPESQSAHSMNTFILVSANEPDAAFAGLVKRSLYTFDPRIVPTDVVPLRNLRGQFMGYENFVSQVLKILSGFALVMAVVGLFCVLSYVVDRRMTEFGVRLALGATPRDLISLVVTRGLLLAAAGVACGLGASLALTRFMQSLLFETVPHDPLVLALVAMLLLVSAALACMWPALRAAKVDVARLLRAE